MVMNTMYELEFAISSEHWALVVPLNVGPPFAYGPSIMSLGAGLFRIRAMIGSYPIMSFDFGGLKI